MQSISMERQLNRFCILIGFIPIWFYQAVCIESGTESFQVGSHLYHQVAIMCNQEPVKNVIHQVLKYTSQQKKSLLFQWMWKNILSQCSLPSSFSKFTRQHLHLSECSFPYKTEPTCLIRSQSPCIWHRYLIRPGCQLNIPGPKIPMKSFYNIGPTIL